MSDNRIRVNGQSYLVKRAILAAADTANETLVAAVVGKRIRVLSVHIGATGAAGVRFESTSGGTALTPVLTVSLTSSLGSMNLPHNEYGWFETNAGELLNVERTGAGTSGVLVTYIEV